MTTDTATIWIDGRRHEGVDPSKNLLQVALELGYDLPYFCWHPDLGSVGACRQCAVTQFEDVGEENGTLVMACMTAVQDGARISIADETSADFRASVIEWLMVNHPHDCPVCDEGGECHLQDMTVMTGHSYREFRFRKRTFRNQYLGPLIHHEMNRCIQCYRCVRFYEHAGGDDLQAMACHDHVYFGRHEDGVLESPFAGNLVEVCPTGVFTDKTLKRHYTRKWDLQSAPSVCVHCGLGCNTIPGERYGELRRIRNRYHGEVNGYFLCDRGRYGYEFVNHERRIRGPLLPRGERRHAERIGGQDALRRLAPRIGGEKARGGKILGVGSPRASVEANFALRALVGEGNFYRGVDAAEARVVDAVLDVLRRGPARTPSLREVESCDAALVLGEDPTNTAPLLDLALRQSVRTRPMETAQDLGIPAWHDAAVRDAIQDAHGPLVIASPAPTELDEIASRTVRAAPEEIARLGYAAAHALDDSAPRVEELDDETARLAREIASTLAAAERPLVVSGFGGGSEAMIHAAANVTTALSRRRGRPADLFLTVPECDSLGLAMLGGEPLEAAFERADGGDVETVIVLENDLFRRAPRSLVERFLSGSAEVVVIDHLAHETAARADVVLPAATFTEGDGTLVNNEGRAQRHYQVFVPEGEIQESWRWSRDLMNAAGRMDAADWHELDDIVAAVADSVPAFAGLPNLAPPADFRIAGSRVPRAPHRYSGRTAMVADRDVHEPPPPSDPDAPLAYSMEGTSRQPPAPLVSNLWSPGWNSVQALNRFQEEIAGPLRGGDAGLRLLDPDGSERGGPGYHPQPPPRFEPDEGDRLRLVPLHHVFGSEELSALSGGVAELAPDPYVALSPRDAERLGLTEGDETRVDLDGSTRRLPVRVVEGLRHGVAGLPIGLPDLASGSLPLWGTIQREEDAP